MLLSVSLWIINVTSCKCNKLLLLLWTNKHSAYSPNIVLTLRNICIDICRYFKLDNTFFCLLRCCITGFSLMTWNADLRSLTWNADPTFAIWICLGFSSPAYLYLVPKFLEWTVYFFFIWSTPFIDFFLIRKWFHWSFVYSFINLQTTSSYI